MRAVRLRDGGLERADVRRYTFDVRDREKREKIVVLDLGAE